MNSPRGHLSLLLLLGMASLRGEPMSATPARTYRVQQTVTLSDIPAGARTVKWWIAIPGDDRFQQVLDFTASVPGDWHVVREPDHGGRFLFAEVSAPATSQLTAQFDFTVRRQAVWVDIDPGKVGPLTETHRRLFADEMRLDSPHMEVTPGIVALATKACGSETNPATEVRLLLQAVADSSTHYSRDPSKPKYSVGDAGSCIAKGGGTCTDIHSLFISLARSRGIPARLQMGYRLRESNEGKSVDAGYRCWAEYYLPGYGWVPTDLVEADDPKGLGRDRWFSGLTERRLWLNEGREFNIAGRSAARGPVNLMVIGYAEIDGVEARVLPEGGRPAQISRTVFYKEVAPASTNHIAAN